MDLAGWMVEVVELLELLGAENTLLTSRCLGGSEMTLALCVPDATLRSSTPSPNPDSDSNKSIQRLNQTGPQTQIVASAKALIYRHISSKVQCWCLIISQSCNFGSSTYGRNRKQNTTTKHNNK